jgi:hypothetical protein
MEPTITQLADGTYYAQQICCGLNVTATGATEQDALDLLAVKVAQVVAQNEE